MSRLLVVEPDGHLSVRRSDAVEERSSLGAPRAGEHVAATCWGGDGRTVVSSHVGADDAQGRLVVHDLTGGHQTVHDDVFPAFYMAPSPDGRRVAHLAPGPLGLELAVLDLATGDGVLVERGQPLFWAWAPDGSRLVVHVADVVVLVDLDDTEPRRTVLTEDPGDFVAPCWLPDDSVVYAAGGRLVSRSPEGLVTTLVDSAVPMRFVIDADGRRVAYVALDDDGRIGLDVLDVLTGSTTRVLEEAPAGFFWDREGRRLAAIVASGLDPRSVRWAVWDGGDVERLPPFVPAAAWVQRVLPFFEQYAQSHAVWSSDGAELVSPATVGAGAAEILVQSVDDPARPAVPLCPGIQAWWAPV